MWLWCFSPATFSMVTGIEIDLRIRILKYIYSQGRKGQGSQWCVENEMKRGI